MRTFPPTFTAELIRRNGAAPVWLLRFTAGGVDYVLCQDAVPITPWALTALPLISSWGRLSEGVSNTLADYRIGELSVDLINNPAAATSLRARVKARQLHGVSVSVYLWFDGISDPPQEMYRYRVRDIDLPSEALINLELQDESIKYENYYPGTIVTAEQYPDADPDDIGKMVPIIFGSIQKSETRAVDAGIKTTLAAGMSAVQTTMTVSDPAGFWIGMWAGIDDETMLVTGITGSTINVTRAYDATIAATHQKGGDVIEIRSNDFAYVAAGHPVQSISKVWARFGNKLMDVTPIATIYTGQAGNEHASYLGQAVITVPGFITISQAAQLMLNDGIGVSDLLTVLDGLGISDLIGVTDGIGISDLIGVTDSIGINNLLSVLDGITVGDNISVSDTIGISDAITVGDTIGVTDGIGVSDTIAVSDTVGVSQGSHPHTTYNATIAQAGNNAPKGDYRTSGSFAQNFGNNVTFDAHGINPANIVDVTYEVTFQAWAAQSVYIYAVGSAYTFYNAAVALLNGTQTMSWTVSHANAYAATGIGVQLYCSGTASSTVPVGVWITAVKRTFRFTDSSSSDAAAGVVKTGSAVKSGGASKTGTTTKTGGATRAGSVSKTGSALKTGSASRTGGASLTGSVSKTGSASKTGSVTRTGNVTRSGSVAKTGTVTLTGNSVANTLIGDAVLVDIVSATTAPGDVIGTVLGVPCQVKGQFPPGYSFNGAITTSRSALAWCHDLSRQCRSYFRWVLGTPTLIARPDVLTPVKSITEIRLANGEMVHGQRLTDVNEVINTINLQYNRDWSGSNSNAPYKSTLSNTDAASITTYGIRERPELFKFDFVTSPTMAADLLAFYLRWQAWQRWQHTQEVYLFEAALEFGDAVALAFLAGEVGECIEVGFNPGNGKNIDKIQLTVIE